MADTYETAKFEEVLSQKQAEVEELLKMALPKEEDFQKTVLEAMNYSILVGGKRLRPILMQETYHIFSQNESDRALVQFMLALEMIHTYSLVHDDLPAMDNDMLRRGQPTTHAKYGEAMAILAGDGLLNLAYETACGAFEMMPYRGDSGFFVERHQRIAKALKVLSRKAGVYGMIGGQVVDVESEKRGDVITPEKLDFIYRLKTGALLEAAMVIGAQLGGASEAEVTIVESVATKIGLAFQIQDDILDVIGDTEILGKPVGSDEKNEKATYVAHYGLEASKAKVAELTESALGQLYRLPKHNRFLEDLIKSLVNRQK